MCEGWGDERERGGDGEEGGGLGGGGGGGEWEVAVSERDGEGWEVGYKGGRGVHGGGICTGLEKGGVHLRLAAAERGAAPDEDEDMQLACRFDFGHINSVTGTKSSIKIENIFPINFARPFAFSDYFISFSILPNPRHIHVLGSQSATSTARSARVYYYYYRS